MARILVVDDDENLSLLYEQEFVDEGYEVELVSNGFDALERVKNDTYDLIILDIRMPDIDGLEVLGQIIGINNKIPVIINTAYSNYRDNYMSWAAEYYVVKSSDLTELKTKVHELLN